MKKIMISAFVLMFITTSSYAQGFRLGAKVGANLGKIDGQSFNDGFNLGYHVGGFAEIDFSPKLGIQPEVIFNQTNTEYTKNTSDILNIKSGDNIKLNYLSVPILLRINTSNLVTILVGPQFSILTNNHKSTVQNVGDAFKSGDFAMAGGLQFNLKQLRVYGRYNIGLNNINDLGNSEDWKTQQIQLGLGLRL